MEGVSQRYRHLVLQQSENDGPPGGAFHASPIARGKSVFDLHGFAISGRLLTAPKVPAWPNPPRRPWVGLDFGCSGADSTSGGWRKEKAACSVAGSSSSSSAQTGTSTSNKIAVCTIVRPGDIVLVDRNCHKSHHYPTRPGGGQPLYVEATRRLIFRLTVAVPLVGRSSKTPFDLKAEGRARPGADAVAHNCTFDGPHLTWCTGFMEEVLAIKLPPDRYICVHMRLRHLDPEVQARGSRRSRRPLLADGRLRRAATSAAWPTWPTSSRASTRPISTPAG